MPEDEGPDIARIKAGNHGLDSDLSGAEHMGPLQNTISVGRDLGEITDCCGAFKDGEQDGSEDFLLYQVRAFLLVRGEVQTHYTNTPGAVVLFNGV
jgi:hypothetical protein